jgi:outer membrane lipoprotein-sorting protein
MNRAVATVTPLLLLLAVGASRAGCCAKKAPVTCSEQEETDPVDEILERLKQQTIQLQSYQANIEYLFVQPDFNSQQLRKGALHYAKFGKQSMLRVNFETLKQEEEKERKYVEQYIFDGVWVTKIDYQLKAVRRDQLVDPNEPVDSNAPVDVFELVSRNFPIVGFSKVEDLKKEFEITLIDDEQAEPLQDIQLHLKVRPDSVYKDDYVSMDFRIDGKTFLPARIVAVSTLGDIYDIRLLKPQLNEKMDKEIFEATIPEGFSVQENPLRKNERQID